MWIFNTRKHCEPTAINQALNSCVSSVRREAPVLAPRLPRGAGAALRS